MTPPRVNPDPAKLRVAVVIHLFYSDQWPEFLAALGNFGQPFRLFVSLPPESGFAPAILADFPDAIVRPMRNVGRDVAPFLRFLPDLQDFDLVCKLHTKRSEVGHRGWRQSLVDGLIGSPAIVRDYLDAFAREPDLILAGPRSAYVDGKSHLYANTRAIIAQHGNPPPDWGFFAGTMFWCRPQVFAGLPEVYPQDAFVAHADRDGQTEHVVERAFGVIACQSGKKIMLHDDRPSIDYAARLRGLAFWYETYEAFQTADTAEPLTDGPSQDPALPRDLLQLFDTAQGPVVEQWTGHLHHYNRIFHPLRDDPVRLLEIGGQNGATLALWSQYFARAQVLVGCSIHPDARPSRHDDPRIRIVAGHATAPDTLTRVMAHSGQFDIIIDDGVQRSGDILRSFHLFFPTLSERGIYVIEDLYHGYRPDFEGGLGNGVSSLAFFRMLTDFINRAHWQDQKDPAALLQPFAAAYGIDFDPVIFQRIASIEFVNAMVILRSGPATETGLGSRRVRGGLAPVKDAIPAPDRGADGDRIPASRTKATKAAPRTTAGDREKRPART